MRGFGGGSVIFNAISREEMFITIAPGIGKGMRNQCSAKKQQQCKGTRHLPERGGGGRAGRGSENAAKSDRLTGKFGFRINALVVVTYDLFIK